MNNTIEFTLPDQPYVFKEYEDEQTKKRKRDPVVEAIDSLYQTTRTNLTSMGVEINSLKREIVDLKTKNQGLIKEKRTLENKILKQMEFIQKLEERWNAKTQSWEESSSSGGVWQA